MSRRHRVLFGAASLVVLLAGAGAWYRFGRPEPPKPQPEQERKYEEISRPEYEQWMQSLGYTE